jgi:hypothetical protein
MEAQRYLRMEVISSGLFALAKFVGESICDKHDDIFTTPACLGFLRHYIKRLVLFSVEEQ